MKKHTFIIIIVSIIIVIIYGRWLLKNTLIIEDNNEDAIMQNIPPAPPITPLRRGGIPEDIKRAPILDDTRIEPIPLTSVSNKKQGNVGNRPLPSDPDETSFFLPPTIAPPPTEGS